ncbi:MAG: heme-binding protein [Methylococcaceae bacterium]|nr:heme-binding protein [Methylococcaceae bacterium]
MSVLTLKKANQIIHGSLTKARQLKLAPLTVVVLDENGFLKAMQREDGATMLKQDIAMAKAWGAVNMGMSSRSLAVMAEQRPAFMNALVDIADGKVMPAPGGVLIRDEDNHIIGAVGISGDVSDQDERSAVAGIKEAGLIAGI